jgi:phage protein U
MSLYAVLNDIELEIITWLDGMEASFAADYAEQGLIGRKSLLQYTGHRPDEIRIDARLHAQWCNPADELRRVKAKMDAREPVAFVLGTGEYRGIFVISDLQLTTTQTDGKGAAIAFELSITLREYIGDPAEPNPPGVITAGYRIPIEAESVTGPGMMAGAPLDTPGGIAQAVASGVSAIAEGSRIAADISSLASLASGNPAAAALALPGVAAQVAAFVPSLPVETMQGLQAVSSVATDAAGVAQAFGSARDQFAMTATALDAGLAGLPSALYSASDGARVLDGARGALSRMASAAATRLPVSEAWS